MDRSNRRILAASVVLASISLYGCEDTVNVLFRPDGGLVKTTTDGVTGEETYEVIAPPPPSPPPAVGVKSDVGRG